MPRVLVISFKNIYFFWNIKNYFWNIKNSDIITLFEGNLAKSKNLVKIVNIIIDKENQYIFQTTWGIAMNFSRKMCFMIILKVTKKQNFFFSLEKTVFSFVKTTSCTNYMILTISLFHLFLVPVRRHGSKIKSSICFQFHIFGMDFLI